MIEDDSHPDHSAIDSLLRRASAMTSGDQSTCRHCDQPIIRVHCGPWVTADGIEECAVRVLLRDGYSDHEPAGRPDPLAALDGPA